jgi:hypothetical protein
VTTPPIFRAAVSFPPGYLTQAVTLTIAQVPEGCFTPSSPSPSFTDHGCYSFTTSPRVDNPLNCTAQPGDAPATPEDLVKCARVEVCPTLGPGDPNYHNLRMFKSDPGTPAQELPEAPALLLAGDCPPFVPPGGGDGLGLALNRWHGIMNAIGRLVMPRALFAASAMAHTGLGGTTCCFSNIGWALTARFDGVSVTSPLDIGGLEGTATVSVSNGTGAPASGLEVKGFIVQEAARRSAGTSGQTNGLFTCASGTCTLKGFNFVANNALDGTGTLVCGPASAEFDLIQDSVLVQTTTTPITLSNRGGCGE